MKRDVAVVVPSFTAAAAIVAATDFVTTLLESFMKQFGASFGVRKLSAPLPSLDVAIKLAWHERTASDPLMREFRNIVEKAVRSARPRQA